MKKYKIKKVGINKILTPIVVLLLLLFIQMLLNFDGLCHLCNMSSYEKQTAVISRTTTDKFLLVIPMVEIQYSYGGQAYSEEKYFVVPPLFGRTDETGAPVPVYVNTLAPGHTLFRLNFFLCPANILILLLEAVCVCMLIFRIRRNVKVRRLRKAKKKGGDDREDE